LDDVAKLLDFGLVRPIARLESVEDSTVGPVGTPAFMSPEQILGSSTVDARSDIYSLGAVAYYLLTGRPPFEARSGIGTLVAHVRDPVVPPSRWRAEIPSDLEQIVLDCLAKEPSQRPTDVDALERAFAACACAADWDKDRARQWWFATSEAPDESAIGSKT
jgi:serine/threonine-protein kinase